LQIGAYITISSIIKAMIMAPQIN